jgi:iron complex outermembrane receptor protein
MSVSFSSSAQETRPEEIIVTSTALRENALDIAQSAIVISGDALRRDIASSIGETIDTQLGVSATYFGPTASRPVIRGLGGDRVLMLQDGLSALDVSSLSQDHAVSIESVLADQIEILRGPATLLFGSGAVGGVVNVVDGRIPTLFSEGADRAAIEMRTDSASDERTGVARLEFGSEKVRVHVDGFRRSTEDVDIPGYAFSASEREEHLSESPDETFERGKLHNSASETGGGAIGFSTGGPDGFFGFAASRFESEYGIPAAHGHTEEDEEDSSEEHGHEKDHEHDVRIDMRQDRYDLKTERALGVGPWERLRVRAAYSDYEHRELEGAEVGTQFEQQGLELRLNVDHSAVRGWRGTLGTHYLNTDFTAEGLEAFTPPSRTEQVGAFIFEKRSFGNVAVELGSRVEHQSVRPAGDIGYASYDGTAYSFSGGAVWDFSGEHSAAINLTRSQRHPQSSELYANGAHLATARYEIGAPGLDKETANTVDLTLHRHSDAGPHWSISAFYNDFADYIYAQAIDEEAAGVPVFRYTQAGAELYGLEAEVTLPIVASSQASFEVRIASDYVRGTLEDGSDLPQLPPWRYGMELHYERGALHLGLEGYAYAKQKKVAAFERPTDGYTMVDADISYRVALGQSTLLLFLRGNNLLDEEARRHTSPLKEVAPLPGRSLILGVRAEI